MFRNKVLSIVMAAATCLTLSNCGGGNNDNEKSMFADDSIIMRSEEYGYALLEGYFHSVTLLGSDTEYIKSLKINRDGGYEMIKINSDYDPDEELEEGELPKTHYLRKGQPWHYKNEAKNVSILELRNMTSETTQRIVEHTLTITWLSETDLDVEIYYQHEGKEVLHRQRMTLIETPETEPTPANSL